MTEFKFFANREERWSDSMGALWGSLSICPLLDHVTSHITQWGNYFL